MTMNWRPIPGFSSYEASSDGDIRSIDRPATTPTGHPYIRHGRTLKPSINRGRRTVQLVRDGVTFTRPIHVLVTLAFHGPKPEGFYSCHNDGNPMNDQASNLRWDSPSANQQDMVAHGNHRNARKVECKRGHPLVGENIILRYTDRGSGVQRQCRECRRLADRARQPRRRRHVTEVLAPESDR